MDLPLVNCSTCRGGSAVGSSAAFVTVAKDATSTVASIRQDGGTRLPIDE